MSGFVAKCPVCDRKIVVHSLIASCGNCGVATGATDAKDTWEILEE
jgi:uncharacterized protein (DUF983 family)